MNKEYDFDNLSKQFHDAHESIKIEQETFWNSLTKEQQLKVFCAVVRRIVQAEMIDKGSYRHALYGVFEFGPESYAQAQMAGYLDLHNSIMYEDYDSKLLNAFCQQNKIEDSEEKIRKFIL